MKKMSQTKTKGTLQGFDIAVCNLNRTRSIQITIGPHIKPATYFGLGL